MIIKDKNLPEILPCPFCGKPGELHVDEYAGFDNHKLYTVACGVSWGTDAVSQCYGQLTLDRDGEFSFCWKTAEEAIEVWNNRNP